MTIGTSLQSDQIWGWDLPSEFKRPSADDHLMAVLSWVSFVIYDRRRKSSLLSFSRVS